MKIEIETENFKHNEKEVMNCLVNYLYDDFKIIVEGIKTTLSEDYKTSCDKCFKEITETDNIFEDKNGDCICQDCLEAKNEQYYNMYHKN